MLCPGAGQLRLTKINRRCVWQVGPDACMQFSALSNDCLWAQWLQFTHTCSPLSATDYIGDYILPRIDIFDDVFLTIHFGYRILETQSRWITISHLSVLAVALSELGCLFLDQLRMPRFLPMVKLLLLLKGSFSISSKQL